MFDVGFSELVVIAIVALVVIGPERLPKVARTAGLMLGRLQRYVNDVKADISREMQVDELKKIQSELQDSVRSLEHSVRSEVESIEQSVGQTVASAQAAVRDLESQTTSTAPAVPTTDTGTGAADSGAVTAASGNDRPGGSGEPGQVAKS